MNAQVLYEISLISKFSRIGTFWSFWLLLGLKLLPDGGKIFFWCSISLKTINRIELIVCAIH